MKDPEGPQLWSPCLQENLPSRFRLVTCGIGSWDASTDGQGGGILGWHELGVGASTRPISSELLGSS